VQNRVLVTHSETSANSGDLNPATKHLHCLNILNGAIVWSYEQADYDTSINGAVCSNGRQVFFCTPTTTGPNLRALVLTNGFDFANTGGTGLDATGAAWDQTLTTTPLQAAMTCDRERLYLGFFSSATYQIECRGAGDGVLIWAVAHPDASVSVRRIWVDQDYLYCSIDDTATDEGWIECRDKRTGGLVWTYIQLDGSSDPIQPIRVVSDGQKVYALTVGQSYLWQLQRDNKPTRFLRVDPVSHIGGIANLKLQPEQS
jgi:outer membrane protein assembly factor BamB